MSTIVIIYQTGIVSNKMYVGQMTVSSISQLKIVFSQMSAGQMLFD
jgi:hypothetical protein